MSQNEPTSLHELPPWALRCPEGHTCWEPIDGHFVCRSCSRHEEDRDGRFELVENVMTGERLDREELAQLEEHACRQEAGAD